MKKVNQLISIFILIMTLTASIVSVPDVSARSNISPHLTEAYGKLPLRFEANLGQTDPAAKFISRGPGYSMYLTEEGFVLALSQLQGVVSAEDTAEQPAAPAVVQMSLAGEANAPRKIEGLHELAGRSNYLIGDDRSEWVTNVPNYTQVRYDEIYSGIDLQLYGNSQGQLEYDFIVAPGSDPNQIVMEFAGAESVELDEVGNIRLRLPGGETLHQYAPTIYQERNGEQLSVAGSYTLSGDQVRLQLGHYDEELPLVIDPVLYYSTFLGGSSNDIAYDIAVDQNGSAYVTGYTYSLDFVVSDSGNYYDGDHNGSEDVFVTKIDPTGTAFIYSTYIGGDDNEGGLGIAVDSNDQAYITGYTRSYNFPEGNGGWGMQSIHTQGSFGSGYLNGTEDAFAIKVSATGSDLVYANYLGGWSNDRGQDIAVDSAGAAYITGYTFSEDFPVEGSYLQYYLQGSEDVFVTKVSPEGDYLEYSTYLGSSSTDVGTSIAVDSGGYAYVAGYSYGWFPITYGSFDDYPNGAQEGFVAKINTNGPEMVYSTFLGGSGNDAIYDLALDGGNNVYLTGKTYSQNFPTTAGAFDRGYSGGEDVFVTKLDAFGANLIYSTFLGGSLANSANDAGYGLAVDLTGQVFVTGYTYSASFPTTPDAFDTSHNGNEDVFITHLSEDGSQLMYSSFLGAQNNEAGYGVAVDFAGNAYVTGYTRSNHFPTAGEVPEPVYQGGGIDAFIAKIYVNGELPQDPDADNDGLPDQWEADNGLDPQVNDANSDLDHDGLTNLEEYQGGTNPNDHDSDNDGMPDGWEVDNAFNPKANDSSGDLDDDGLTNLEEFQNGTHPNDGDSDNDALPDGWEVDNNLNPLVDDASGDPDHDNLTNLEEYQGGTDPHVAQQGPPQYYLPIIRK
ncbi:MAG: SBBP repeat-containing protein [Anaerolineae bacterium]|nr:SBBP repeat-containing protein [Anaerolineae bacterium]